MSADSPAVRRATIADLQSARDANKKFAVVTAYDRATAEIAEAAGIGAREDFRATLHAIFVKKHEHTLIFDQAFDIYWRRRGLIDKLIAMMSPIAEPKDPKAGKAQAGATRSGLGVRISGGGPGRTRSPGSVKGTNTTQPLTRATPVPSFVRFSMLTSSS